eukprot:Opistho-2@47527
MFQLSKNMVLLSSGESGDSVQFCEYVEKNVKFYEMKNGIPMSPHAAANFIRNAMASSLRSRSHYNVNLLMAGYDPTTKAGELYYLDYLASLNKLAFGAHGYASYFVLSILDRHYKPGMSVAEIKKLMAVCIAEVQKRMVINLPKFSIRLIDATGVHVVDSLE